MDIIKRVKKSNDLLQILLKAFDVSKVTGTVSLRWLRKDGQESVSRKISKKNTLKTALI